MGCRGRFGYCGFCNEGLMELAIWDGTGRPRLTRVAMLMACGAGLTAVLAGCSPGSGSPGASASSPAATGTGTAAAIAPFVPIVEPFDPGHPARVESAPDTCG